MRHCGCFAQAAAWQSWTGLDADTPKGPPMHVRASAETIAEMLESAGFTDVAVHPGLRWHTLVTGSAAG